MKLDVKKRDHRTTAIVKTHKLLCMLLLSAALLSALAFPGLAAYEDTGDSWARPAIEKWSDLGIVKGNDSMFHPNDPITRGEMAVILDRLMKYQTRAENHFTDLNQAFYTDALLKVNAAAVISGYGNQIRPTDVITREETTAVLARTFRLSPDDSSSLSFKDANTISPWAVGSVISMTERGYIQGNDGLFRPKDPITRAEFVHILDISIASLYTAEGDYTGNFSGIVIINTPGTVLHDMKITGDLIIAEGVGSGDVTLKNVTVTGKTIIRGGGPDSIHIEGNSQISEIILQKTDDGSVRVVTSDGTVVKTVYIDDGKDDVILTGSFERVTVVADVTVKVVDADIKDVDITGTGANLDIDKDSSAVNVTVAATATGAGISVSGSIETLTVGAKTRIQNNGTISSAQVNANGIVIDGKAPADIKVGSAVTEGPKDGSGNPVDTSSGSPTGGSPSGGGPSGGGPSGGGPASFTASTNSSTANDTATLGLVGTTVSSSANGVAATAISNGKIAITSVSAGTATITVTDASSHHASIAVTVASDGSITIGTITKYETSSISGVAATNGTVTITLAAKPAEAPVAADFTATIQIASGAENPLTLAAFNYDGNVTVTYSFTPVAQAESLQNVKLYIRNGADTLEAQYEVQALQPQSAPTGLAAVAPTTYGGTDGMITGVSSDMEYAAAGTTPPPAYMPVSGSPLTGLSPGWYYVRYAAKPGYAAGPVVSIQVLKGQIGFVISGPTLYCPSPGVLVKQYNISGEYSTQIEVPDSTPDFVFGDMLYIVTVGQNITVTKVSPTAADQIVAASDDTSFTVGSQVIQYTENCNAYAISPLPPTASQVNRSQLTGSTVTYFVDDSGKAYVILVTNLVIP